MEINATLIGQLFTFALLVWFTVKFVWPPITKVLLEREKKIAAGLQAAERSQKELEQAQHKIIEILREARSEAAGILEQANRRSAKILEEARETAQEESQRILEGARDEISREVGQAREALRKQLAILAVAGAAKILSRNLDVAAQHDLLEEFVAEI